ncbi:hypothetical protein BD779DRAFT_1613005 [Infundibulicybe gibba]|nr:hypothetical protein BD779DRAFT_1613005 [Infundibulicybe gibba]
MLNCRNVAYTFPVPFPSNYTPSPGWVESNFAQPDVKRKDYHEWNARTLRDLHVCMALHNCGRNQKKVALLAAHWFQEAIVGDFRGGEGICLREMGYTTLFSISFASCANHNTPPDEALHQYRMMPELVKVVIRNKAGECHSNSDCVKGPSNPSGIPAWKIFDFEFFPSHGTHYHSSLMKGKWILSANPDDLHEGDSPIQCIGRVRLPRTWMLMKELSYVYKSTFAWNRTYFARASHELGLNFIGAWRIDQHYGWNSEVDGEMVDIADPENGIVNLGEIGPQRFEQELGMSRVIVGMGDPWWSPSPYDALCRGFPSLIRYGCIGCMLIIHWAEDQPENRTRWMSQHPTLSKLDPPYVYNVYAGDYDGFVKALKAASTTEINSYIPPYMTDAAVRERVKALMETDWRARAADLLAQGSGSYIFEL